MTAPRRWGAGRHSAHAHGHSLFYNVTPSADGRRDILVLVSRLRRAQSYPILAPSSRLTGPLLTFSGTRRSGHRDSAEEKGIAAPAPRDWTGLDWTLRPPPASQPSGLQIARALLLPRGSGVKNNLTSGSVAEPAGKCSRTPPRRLWPLPVVLKCSPPDARQMW